MVVSTQVVMCALEVGLMTWQFECSMFLVLSSNDQYVPDFRALLLHIIHACNKKIKKTF